MKNTWILAPLFIGVFFSMLPMLAWAQLCYTPGDYSYGLDFLSAACPPPPPFSGGNNSNLLYPDGSSGTPVTRSLSDSTLDFYTVPEGKTLYITKAHGSDLTNGGGVMLTVNDIPVALLARASSFFDGGMSLSNGLSSSGSVSFSSPIVVGAGSWVGLTNSLVVPYPPSDTVGGFNGFLVEAGVKPVTSSLSNNTLDFYSVPEGKTLYITNAYGEDHTWGGAVGLSVHDVSVALLARGNVRESTGMNSSQGPYLSYSSGSVSFSSPIVVGAGSWVGLTNSLVPLLPTDSVGGFNGYLANSNEYLTDSNVVINNDLYDEYTAGYSSCQDFTTTSCRGDQVVDSCGNIVSSCSDYGQICDSGLGMCVFPDTALFSTSEKSSATSCALDGTNMCQGNNVVDSCGNLIQACTSRQMCRNGQCINNASACTPTGVNLCQGNSIVDSCGNLIRNCAAGQSCSGDRCIWPAPTASLVVTPILVRSGNTAQVSWSARYVSQCTVSSSNSDSWSCTDSACNATSTKVSAAITYQTVFTLSCAGLDGSNISKTAIVNILPTFQEQ